MFLIYDVTIIIIIFITFDTVWNQICDSLKRIESVSISLHNFRLGYDKELPGHEI
jgi:hypothetical protein